MRQLMLFLLYISMVSCGNSGPDMGIYADSDMDFEMPLAEQTLPNASSKQDIPRKVIKNGSIRFQSDNVSKDYQQVKSILSRYDSYIDSENEVNSGYQINIDLSIRVSSSSYDSLFNQLTHITSKVDHKSSNIEDVTTQFYDLKTRIENKKLLEEKYTQLLTKAKTVKDILEIERSINEIRNDIESAEGSFRYLSKQVSYSTIQLNIYELTPSGQETQSFWSQITKATSRGWNSFIVFILGAIQAWPFIIISVLIVYVIKRFRKKKLQKKQG